MTFNQSSEMPPPRLPTLDDIPRNIVCDIVPPTDGKPTNVLILLHGLGDTKEGFTKLGEYYFVLA
jgi:hypothetical protein